ncbi:acetyl-CoA carboxylase biotin carboxyl carrier protein [Candidatus Termititenax persephonae]|uniref:Biotin carboxyl carrier protein of acetyl-CoA carboxylase n=1 Tax=Candidatus Termititenax persephonae TaxID=2218525 RepID=A0A388TGF6_9BACT|nr:acetyl-CoA carboxylase biotin carboxyl carrier protein [Candidatus Termititenax persephonae]
MDFQRIEQFIKLVEQSDINGLTIEEGDCKIEIQKSNGPAVIPAGFFPPAPVAAEAADLVAVPETARVPGLQEIRSPMSGTFYQASAPDAAPLVKVGDRVDKGQPVCIVEAMKTFNEIEADSAGTIEEILAGNAQPVEAGQPLFRIRA